MFYEPSGIAFIFAAIFTWRFIRRERKRAELKSILKKIKKGESIFLQDYKYVKKEDLLKFFPDLIEIPIDTSHSQKTKNQKELLSEYKQSVISDLLKKRKFSV